MQACAGVRATERNGLFKRHFFLIATLVVLALMLVAGGLKVLSTAPAQGLARGGGPGAAAGGGGGP
ncbi:MAG: hypothetical protein ACK53I_07185, partial [Phenylobacterium sp.]